jgi:arsenate reductase-like glutaredoxin family protein
MAFNEKYTWADFLRENPDKKGLKRTTAEGKKAFESAFKGHIKGYIKDRVANLEKRHAKTTQIRDELVTRLKALKTPRLAKRMQERVGQKDHAMAVIAKQIERTKDASKRF